MDYIMHLLIFSSDKLNQTNSVCNMVTHTIGGYYGLCRDLKKPFNVQFYNNIAKGTSLTNCF